jgi:hypothetical protein
LAGTRDQVSLLFDARDCSAVGPHKPMVVSCQHSSSSTVRIAVHALLQ